MKKRRIRDRHKASDAFKYCLRPFRLKIKKHKSKSKKSFYAKAWWELHFRDCKKLNRLHKKLLQFLNHYELKCKKSKMKLAYVSHLIWSFHNGDNGNAYFLCTKSGKSISDRNFSCFEEAALFAYAIGYDEVIEFYNTTFILE